MKRILSFILPLLTLCLPAFQGMAQSGTYGNEWIDSSKTYYKFKVAKAGICRIQRATLDAAGLPAAVTPANFILYRDGQEVPLYISAAGDIEFAGRGADGTMDKELYENVAWQPDTRICMFTDTAAYFLTWDTNTGHARIDNTANTIPTTPPAAEAYNWTTVGNYYKNILVPGPSYDTTSFGVGIDNFYSPSFDNGEGFVNAFISGPSSITLNTPNVVAAGVNANLRTSVVTSALHTQHQITILVNGNQVASAGWGNNETRHFTPSFPASQLVAANTISYNPVAISSGQGANYVGVSYVELEYPRNYDLNGLNTHSFRLSASSAAQYLEFNNFTAPSRLYDVTNRKAYDGNVSGNKTRFYILPSLADRQLVLVATANATSLSVAKTIQFTDYQDAANQADYIILTHKQLIAGGTAIDDYKTYRSSTNGGGHKVKVVDVTDLYDQFGYGYDMHPQSIRHFLQYAYDKWQFTKPVYVNIIGHGLQYDQYKNYYASPAVYTFPVVPVYGTPGSDVDFVNFGNPRTQKLQIGRVSVWNVAEVAQYLNKIKSYEDELRVGGTATELWKKRVMHIAHGVDEAEMLDRLAVLEAGRAIIEDTLIGANVNTFTSGSTTPGPIQLAEVDSLINSGQALITYYGHASANQFGYNLHDPSTYHASPKFPVFIALGCDVAQMFTASSGKVISETYTLSPTGGAIALLATDNYGYTDFLDNYFYEYYKNIAYRNYGGSVGLNTMKANNAMVTQYQGFSNFRYFFTQVECTILAGDPGAGTYGPPQTDYHVASNAISAIPGNINSTTDSFQLRITAYNLARAIHDTVQIRVTHTNPAGTVSAVGIGTFNMINLLNTDTLYVWVKVNAISDLGLNKYHVTIDPLNKYNETNELNNDAEFTLFISSDNVIPLYPHEFAIVHKQGVTLKASTLNPFRTTGRYFIELDTTTEFNSPAKLQTTITGRGGLIKWTPSLVMKDSTVYYWRTTMDSALNGGSLQWAVSSFVYLAKGSDGWNQSHYFQYKRDTYTDMDLKDDRIFKYDFQDNDLLVYDKVILQDADGTYNSVYYNNSRIQRGPQSSGSDASIQIMVIDSVSGKFWMNHHFGIPGIYSPSDPTKGSYLTEFNVSDARGRKEAIHYIDSIPNGNYVMIKNIFWQYAANITGPNFIDQWKTDTLPTALGSGHSLYHTIRNLGFTTIDSFTQRGVFLFMKKKGAITNMTQQWTTNINDTLAYRGTIAAYGTAGYANGTVIGPASHWTSLKWKQHASDGLDTNDHAYVSVHGITAAGTDSLLFNVYARDTLLDSIHVATYPKLRLVWHTLDTATSTAPQLDYWRVLYTPIPEAALNPSAFYTFSDSLQTGQTENFGVAIENLTDIDFRDSMLVTYKVINANGISTTEGNIRYKKLLGADTLHATYSFNPAKYPGKNTFFVEANPNNDQPEQYHPNNLGYLPFVIGIDKNNPLLDVTFDGVHILDHDIVSAKPFIKISLKDDNKYLALDDTSLITLSLKGINPVVTIPLTFNGTTCKFIPGQTGANGKNTAVIEIRQDLADNENYTLEVQGKDKSNNLAGTPQGSSTVGAKYVVDFTVINKATVTNVLNYPNPFSTATSFVFTITGSQIPSQFKIQVLTVTGKVVREITKNELGPLHIGRNITEYKWDGRDQYGQLLGNGVYMYRVATSLNGEQIEHRDIGNGGDRFFKNGYGKMYIMR